MSVLDWINQCISWPDRKSVYEVISNPGDLHLKYSKNVPGDFYVKYDCCTFCGVPDSIAPNLFGGIENGKVVADQCYVKKQPENDKEIDQMIEVMSVQDLDCIR